MSEVNIHRRDFMKSSGIGAFAVLGAGLLPAEARAEVKPEIFKTASIETIAEDK